MISPSVFLFSFINTLRVFSLIHFFLASLSGIDNTPFSVLSYRQGQLAGASGGHPLI